MWQGGHLRPLKGEHPAGTAEKNSSRIQHLCHDVRSMIRNGFVCKHGLLGGLFCCLKKFSLKILKSKMFADSQFSLI